MGDFLGFTFGNIHSSDLGITRVSGGDRYDEELHPEIKDITTEVPGLDGQYYFGSNYGTREFNIDFAFDHLTEQQFRKLRTVFGKKQIQKLVFDERPYKYYMAKIANPIELSYVCFDEPYYTWEKIETEYNEYVQGVSGDFEYKHYDGTIRTIYKGEGKITFVCHYPFAKSSFKQVSYLKTKDENIIEDKTYYIFNFVSKQFEEVNNPTVEDLSLYYEDMTDENSSWVISSGILSANAYMQVDKFIPRENDIPAHINIYNPGDLPTGFRLYCPFSALDQLNSQQAQVDSTIVAEPRYTYNMTITYEENLNEEATATLQIQNLQKINTDIGIIINTDTGLILGVSKVAWDNDGNRIFTTSGNLYNRFVTGGYFFKLNPHETALDRSTIYITEGFDEVEIYYDYLYF